MPAGSEHPAGVKIQQEGPRGEQEEQTEVSSGLGPGQPSPGIGGLPLLGQEGHGRA